MSAVSQGEKRPRESSNEGELDEVWQFFNLMMCLLRIATHFEGQFRYERLILCDLQVMESDAQFADDASDTKRLVQ